MDERIAKTFISWIQSTHGKTSARDQSYHREHISLSRNHAITESSMSEVDAHTSICYIVGSLLLILGYSLSPRTLLLTGCYVLVVSSGMLFVSRYGPYNGGIAFHTMSYINIKIPLCITITENLRPRGRVVFVSLISLIDGACTVLAAVLHVYLKDWYFTAAVYLTMSIVAFGTVYTLLPHSVAWAMATNQRELLGKQLKHIEDYDSPFNTRADDLIEDNLYAALAPASWISAMREGGRHSGVWKQAMCIILATAISRVVATQSRILGKHLPLSFIPTQYAYGAVTGLISLIALPVILLLDRRLSAFLSHVISCLCLLALMFQLTAFDPLPKNMEHLNPNVTTLTYGLLGLLTVSGGVTQIALFIIALEFAPIRYRIIFFALLELLVLAAQTLSQNPGETVEQMIDLNESHLLFVCGLAAAGLPILSQLTKQTRIPMAISDMRFGRTDFTSASNGSTLSELDRDMNNLDSNKL